MPGKSVWYVLANLIIHFTGLIAPAGTAFTVRNITHGSDFMKGIIGVTYRIADHVHFKTQIDVNPFLHSADRIRQAASNPLTICDAFMDPNQNPKHEKEKFAHCTFMVNQVANQPAYRSALLKHESTWKHLISLLGVPSPDNSRSKRDGGGVFNFLGDINHYITGVSSHTIQQATDDQIEVLKKRLSQIAHLQDQRTVWVQNIISETLHVNNQTLSTLEESQKILANEMEGVFEENHLRDQIQLFLSDLQMSITLQTIQMEEILTAVTFAREGRVPESMVHQERFRAELATLKTHFNTGYGVPFDDSTNHWEILLQIARTTHSIRKGVITLTITLPVCDQTVFNIEQWTALPWPIAPGQYEYRAPKFEIWVRERSISQAPVTKGYSREQFMETCEPVEERQFYCKTFTRRDIALNKEEILTAPRRLTVAQTVAIPTQQRDEYLILAGSEKRPEIIVYENANMQRVPIAMPVITTCNESCVMMVGEKLLRASNAQLDYDVDILTQIEMLNFTDIPITNYPRLNDSLHALQDIQNRDVHDIYAKFGKLEDKVFKPPNASDIPTDELAGDYIDWNIMHHVSTTVIAGASITLVIAIFFYFRVRINAAHRTMDNLNVVINNAPAPDPRLANL